MRACWLAATAAGCAIALAGCGGGRESTGADPAAVVPASALFYADFVVKPEGSLASSVDSLAARLLSAAQRRRLEASLDNDFNDVSVKRDVLPWVDRRIGIFYASSFRPADLAFVIPTTDPARARATLLRALDADPGLERRSYRGVAYLHSPADGTMGVVGHYAVVAEERGFKAAVDAVKGASLAESPRYRTSVSSLPPSRAATAYADLPRVLRDPVARRWIDRGAPPSLLSQLGDSARQPLLAALNVGADSIALDISAAPIRPALRFSTQGTGLIASLPSDSWAALGAGNLGAKLRTVLEQLDAAGLAAARLQRRFGGGRLELDRDLLSWLDDAALFVRWSNRLSLEAGLVIHSGDRQASARAIRRISAAVSAKRRAAPIIGPASLRIAQHDDTVVAASSEGAAEQGFDRSGALATTPGFTCASAALGGHAVTAFIAVRPALAALGPLAAADHRYRAALPYLRRLTYFVAGWRRVGERDILRIATGSGCGTGVR
ncbi:MAG: hypothetical protein QOJ38_360 [Solirubrobacterales bacterium]|jgi:hypothetical protein|nr:hypothetical protein [Solirubrobacterales bacterium]